MPLAQKITAEDTFDPKYQNNKQTAAAPGERPQSDKEDLAIMTDMAEQAIDSGGGDVVKKAVAQSKNPAQVIAQFIVQLGAQMGEKLSGQGIQINKNLMMEEGGFVEQISDYLQQQYKIPQDIMNDAEKQVGLIALHMAQAKQQPQQAGAQQDPQAQPAPQGGLAAQMGGQGG